MVPTRPIEGFPDYSIAEDGSIFTEATGRIRKPSRTQEGAAKITLFRDGRPYTKSLPLLVANAWLYNDHDPEIFDTPIHLDNNPLNNHVANLRWRPRWFAIKYQRQYWHEEYRYSKVRVQDTKTGEIYDSLIELCQRYGFLYHDVIKSCTRGTDVFPSWKNFRFVD